MNNVLQKLISTAITIGGGIVGTKLVELGWKAFTGDDAPKDLDDTEANMWSAITFATISAAISATIRVASKRGAASAMDKMAAKSADGRRLGRGEV